MFTFSRTRYFSQAIYNSKKLSSATKTPCHVLQDYFNISQYKASTFIRFNKLENVSSENMLKIITFCEQHGFTKKDIEVQPAILRFHPITINEYYTAMGEGGFSNIKLYVLAKFRTICRRSIVKLKENLLIKNETNIVECFKKHLSPCPQDFDVSYSEQLSWSDVHTTVLTEYLKWRLDASHDQITKLIKVHPTIRRKSFRYLCENIDFANELGFSKEKMVKYGYILHAFPQHYKEILHICPEIGGISMKRAMRMYPKIITTSPTNVEKILKTLKKYEISDEAIAKRMNVLHLSPETVEYRLKELRKEADFNVLLYNPNILRLVIHHNRAKSRLSFLKQMQLKCATVSILGHDNSKFDTHIREGKDANTVSDTYALLKGIFMKDACDFENTLKKHPFYLKIPLTVMRDTYNYLKSEQFSDSAILKVIYILLYPKDKIQHHFPKVREFERCRSLDQIKRLNLVLYFIEKEHHFNGDGVWQKTEDEERME